MIFGLRPRGEKDNGNSKDEMRGFFAFGSE